MTVNTNTLSFKEISISRQLKLYFSICLGLFLFILFYDPFDLIRLDSNDKLLFIAGLGGITFFFLSLFLIIIPVIISSAGQKSNRIFDSETILQLSVWVTSTVAMAFYLRYVGKLQMSMYLVFKIALLCLFPPVIVRMDSSVYFLKQQIKQLHEKNKLLADLLHNSENRLKQTETFISENKTEKISLQLEHIIVIKSADNYIDIIYREGEEIKQKMIRNTLKNIEAQLVNYPDFVRCHRAYLINTKHIKKLYYSYKGYRLSIQDYHQDIPVSRQYLMKLKEVMAVLQR